MAISPDVNDSIYNLISELEVGRDISKRPDELDFDSSDFNFDF